MRNSFVLWTITLLLPFFAWTPAVGQICDTYEWDTYRLGHLDNGDYWGYSADFDGDTALVGAYGDDDKGNKAGAAYILHHDNGDWREYQKLAPETAEEQQWFGVDVELDGDVALVGGYYQIWFYRYNHQTNRWELENSFTGKDRFGSAVALNGDTALVGSAWDHQAGYFAGAVYVYRYNGNDWVQTQKILGPGPAESQFGRNVDLYGDVAVVGAPYDNTYGPVAGNAYLYTESSNGVWSYSQRLGAPNPSAYDFYGWEVDIGPDMLMIGAQQYEPYADQSSGPGYVDVYQPGGSEWVWTQTLESTSADDYHMFGSSIGFDENVAVIGALDTRNPGAGTGTAYLFRWTGYSWRLEQRLLPSDGKPWNSFGKVELDGDTCYIGAPYHDDLTGEIYMYPTRELNLRWVPDEATAGDYVELQGHCGPEGGRVLVYLISPFTYRFDSWQFDSTGYYRRGGTVPPGLTGCLTFVAYAYTFDGKLVASNPADLCIR